MILEKERTARLSPVLQYVERNYAEPITLKETASLAKMSVPQFVSIFKKVAEMSLFALRRQGSQGRSSFRLPLLIADHLNMTKLPKAFFSELHSDARILIGGSRHKRIPNRMLVNPDCPCLYLAGYSLKFV
jgi:AraC-like DNA-binding protein